MYFSFELADVTCNAVLSSNDSPWGKHDGIRIYFLVLTGNNQKSLLISGREFPEPDIADNLYFSPGKSMVLRNFPPQNGPTWRSDLLDVNGGDTVWCAVIGINEGLPYVAGGGGGFAGKLGEAAIKTFLTSSSIPVSLDLLDVALDSINNAPECRGVAFAYELVLSARYLFANYFTHPTRTLTLNASNASQGLQIISRPKSSSDCGTPSYEVQLIVRLEQQPAVDVNNKSTWVGDGVPRPFTANFGLCLDPNEPIEVWPTLFTNEITLVTRNFFLPNETIWQLEGQTLSLPSGTLTFTKIVTFPVDGSKSTKSVTVHFSVSNVGGVDSLILTNDPADGNYEVHVTLLLRFFDNQPPLIFYDDDIVVTGQGMSGNAAYGNYLKCLEHYRQVVSRYVRGHQWIAPGTPVEQIVSLDGDMLRVAELFNGSAMPHLISLPPSAADR